MKDDISNNIMIDFYKMIIQNLKLKILFLTIIFYGIFGIARNSWAANPVIAPAPSVAVFVTGAYIEWHTDMASDSRVDYGTTTGYGQNVSDASLTLSHHLTVVGLNANSTYHFKVMSGGTSSPDYAFTTYSDPSGTVRTVGSGKTHTTIQACINAASAGDTCLVYSGTYNETPTLKSGTAGNYITVLAQGAVKVLGFSADGKSYVAIKGFEMTGGSFFSPGNSGSWNNVLIENNYMHEGTSGCFAFNSDGAVSSSVIIRNNIMYACHLDPPSSEACISMGASDSLIENNDSEQCADYVFGEFKRSIIRNNVWHDTTIDGSDEHVDGIQTSTNGTGSQYLVVEGNEDINCTDGDCHTGLFRYYSDHVIWRYNYAQNVSGGIGFGGSSDNVPYGIAYNNTLHILSAQSGSALFSSGGGESTSVFLNNIMYLPNNADTGHSPTWGVAIANKNIAYAPGFSGEWNNASSYYSSEATYNTLKNMNPLFVNIALGPEIPNNSPVIDIGGPLTTVSSGCNSNTLVLGNANLFQPGWAGTDPDILAIGSVGNTHAISSISYSTNTVVFTDIVSCANGANVWLYSKSDGARVLYGSAPDIGACEFVSGESDITAPGAPSGLAVD